MAPAGAEPYEILINFSKYPDGNRIELRNLSNTNDSAAVDLV